MTRFRDWLPLPRPSAYRRQFFGGDLMAAFAVLFLAIPQGLAYATIAGLPPAMGLYAAGIPTIVGSLARSSHHVVSGPTNALSLLVGGAVLSTASADPVELAVTLALMVGLMQIVAGLLRLGSLVDFVSSAVISGYITGAGVLIAVGQLHHVIGVEAARGSTWANLGHVVAELPAAEPLALGTAALTVAIIVAARVLGRRTRFRLPSAVVAMSLALLINLAFGLEQRGLKVVADLAPIPSGLPSITFPDLSLMQILLPAAVACTVLSLVESSAVARSIASRTRQRLDLSTEFFGQGLSNLTAAFVGGYPVSGSLARSAVNERAGAKTRLAGIMTGALLVVTILALASLLDHIPVAALAGLLLVIAYDLVDTRKIRQIVAASVSDAVAFTATMVGTWVLSLDLAIYLGVGISLALFLRNARLLRVRELVVDDDGRLAERPPDFREEDATPSGPRRIRLLQIDGALFFGAAGELQDALDDAVRDPAVQVLIVRIKRARGLDATAAWVLASMAHLLRERGRHLLLVGMTPPMMGVLRRSGAHDSIGADNLFPTRDRWFEAFDRARRRALQLCGSLCEDSPLADIQFTAMAPDRAQD